MVNITVEFMLGSFLFIGVINVIYLPVTDDQYLTKLMGIACAQTDLCTIDCGIHWVQRHKRQSFDLGPVNCEVGPGSDLFQCILQVLDWIEIWGILGPGRHFEPFLNSFFAVLCGVHCPAVGATAISDCHSHEGV